MPLYDAIGQSYDITRRADSYITSRLVYYLSSNAMGKCLDLGCGSGNYTLALKGAGLKMAGVDVSKQMLSTACQKDCSIDWLLVDVESLPFAENVFSGAVCVLAIHHFANIKTAFKEAARVISKGSPVIFTSTAEQMEGYWLNEFFPDAMKRSIIQMPRKQAIEESLHEAGFGHILWEPYEVRDDLQDYFLYSGKNRPKLYLDARIRRGSSTFSSLADPKEVEEGCALLTEDIQTGRIKQVMNSYANREEGDYMFVVARK